MLKTKQNTVSAPNGNCGTSSRESTNDHAGFNHTKAACNNANNALKKAWDKKGSKLCSPAACLATLHQGRMGRA
jgi:hypothetical protein